MLARNSDLCRLTASSSVYKRLSSSFIWLTFEASAPSSSRFTTSTWPEKSPAEIAASRESIRWMGSISDHERTRPSSNARTIAPTATAMNSCRDRSYELAFRAIRSSISAIVALASTAASWFRSVESPSTWIARVVRSPSGSVPSPVRSNRAFSWSRTMSSCISTDSRSAFDRIDRRASASSSGGVNPSRSMAVAAPILSTASATARSMAMVRRLTGWLQARLYSAPAFSARSARICRASPWS